MYIGLREKLCSAFVLHCLVYVLPAVRRAFYLFIHREFLQQLLQLIVEAPSIDDIHLWTVTHISHRGTRITRKKANSRRKLLYRYQSFLNLKLKARRILYFLLLFNDVLLYSMFICLC